MVQARIKTLTRSFSATHDDWIVKSFLSGRKVVFASLERLGFSRIDIMNRARRLGLSDQFLKRCAVGNPDVAMRACLGCGERFLSVGVQNRLCLRCKNRNW